MLTKLVQFIVILVVISVALLAALAVLGALSADELKDSLVTILQLAGIVLVASSLVIFITGRGNKS